MTSNCIIYDCSSVVDSIKYFNPDIINHDFYREHYEIKMLITKLTPKFIKVKSHSKNFGNDLAHSIANLKRNSNDQYSNQNSKLLCKPGFYLLSKPHWLLSGSVPKLFIRNEKINNNIWVDKSFWWSKSKSKYVMKWGNDLFSLPNHPPFIYKKEPMLCPKCNTTHHTSIIDTLIQCPFHKSTLFDFLKALQFSTPIKITFFSKLSLDSQHLFLRGMVPNEIAKYLSYKFTPPNILTWEKLIVKFLKNIDIDNILKINSDCKRKRYS